MAVADNLVTAGMVRGHELRAVVVHGGVGYHGKRQAQPVEQFQTPPRADAVAIVPPAVIQYVGLGARRAELRAEALPEGEMLQVVADVQGKTAPLRPVIVGTARDRRI